MSFYRWDFLKVYIKGERPEPEDVQLVFSLVALLFCFDRDLDLTNITRLEYFGAEGAANSSIEYGEFEKNETHAVGRLTDTIVCTSHQNLARILTILLTVNLETERIRFCYRGTYRLSQRD